MAQGGFVTVDPMETLLRGIIWRWVLYRNRVDVHDESQIRIAVGHCGQVRGGINANRVRSGHGHDSCRFHQQFAHIHAAQPRKLLIVCVRQGDQRQRRVSAVYHHGEVVGAAGNGISRNGYSQPWSSMATLVGSLPTPCPFESTVKGRNGRRSSGTQIDILNRVGGLLRDHRVTLRGVQGDTARGKIRARRRRCGQGV